MSDLTSLNLSQMRKGLLDQDFSASELVHAHLERIKEINEKLNSFISLYEIESLRHAENAEKLLAQKGKNTPLLTGIPFAIKDNLVSSGHETTAASKILKGFISPYDCTAVARLTNQGAIIVGNTNLDEFAMGSSCENSAFGCVRNPWNPEHVPGGSSGGSAVAVASGQAPLALGSDTGGSIRLPASFCGIYGLKPTYGRVSRYGAIAYASSLDQIGPFARTVEDIALALSFMSGFDENDSTSMKNDVPDFVSELEIADPDAIKSLRIGVPKEYFIEGLNKEVETAVKSAISSYVKLGAEIVEISLPHTEYALAVYYIIALAEAASNLSRYDGVRYGARAKNVESLTQLYERTRALGFGKEVKRRIMLGTYVLSAGYYDAYYLKAQKVRSLIASDFQKAFTKNCDLIIAPVSPTTAFKLGEKTTSPLEMYLADIFTVPVNLAGLPALSVPCSLDSNKLPLGFQLIGAPFSESLMLKAAKAFSLENNFDTSTQTK
jgi:aspartyl-tRNA(Asn)/glutamyl-tRNA(Gln) amidotransferase subunit A